jgi:hypothetical protein
VTTDRRRFAEQLTSFLLLLGAIGSFARLSAFGHANPILSQLKKERFVPQTCRMFRQACTFCGVPAIPFGRVHYDLVSARCHTRERVALTFFERENAPTVLRDLLYARYPLCIG